MPSELERLLNAPFQEVRARKRGWTRASYGKRDSQRQKVYNADNILKKWAKPLPTVYDMEMYTKKLFDSKRFQKAFPKAYHYGKIREYNAKTRTYEVVRYSYPFIGDGRRRYRTAAGNARGIYMPKWSRTSDVVLHELAHTVSHREYGSGIQGHGWQYAATLLKLVRIMMGKEAHDALKAEYKAFKVRFRAKKKRKPLSEERRAQLKETLAKARAKRKALNPPGKEFVVVNAETGKPVTRDEVGARFGWIEVPHED